MEKKNATIETEKGLLSKSNADLLASARWKEARSFRMGYCFIEAIPPMYFIFAHCVQIAIATYCRKKVFELISFTFELKRNWPRHGEDVNELEVP